MEKKQQNDFPIYPYVSHSHAEVCPVCHGKGTIPRDYGKWISYDEGEKTCHGCGGSGWVTVRG